MVLYEREKKKKLKIQILAYASEHSKRCIDAWSEGASRQERRRKVATRAEHRVRDPTLMNDMTPTGRGEEGKWKDDEAWEYSTWLANSG